MAGCYGNSAEDRYYERMLDYYLDSLEEHEDEEYLRDRYTEDEDDYSERLLEKFERMLEERDGDE